MGSPISVVIAKMVMQRVEEEIFRKIPNDLILWKMYVDHVIAIIPESRLDNTLEQINSVDENIQFTKEPE